jgi:glycine/D-amino acid oxidase-like deaminating enzyme/nitrite reductase/ring-hydroxylating ferredoxin subunit
MKTASEGTISVWMEGAEIPARRALGANLKTDICVVGAGIAGLTTAYLLAREGQAVAVLDDGMVAEGETSRTTAHLVTALDDRYFRIEQLHGEKGARLAAESHAAAIDRIEEIIRTETIDCDFEHLDGYLFKAPEESPSILEKELAAVHRAGLSDIELVSRAPLSDFDTGACLRFPRQAQFHPLHYMNGLALAIEKLGGRIYNRTHAKEFRDGTPCEVTTDRGHIVSCGSVVVATNTPVNDWVAIHTKQAAYRTYVIGLPVPKGSVTKALYWDTPDPYHYVRLQSEKGHDILIAGGEDHKTGQADDAEVRYSRLEAWVRERFTTAGKVRFRWSGQIMEPVDGLAFLGRNPGDQNIYIATGDSGNGMTHGTIAGILITDLVLGRHNDWQSLYDPSRKSLRASPEFARENLNAVARFGEYLTPGEVSSAEEIGRGCGAVIRRGLSKLAAYRDNRGVLHERSAVCPHLGCLVAWNSDEKTWDCPCHGSRFDTRGEVVNGPAASGLAAIE